MLQLLRYITLCSTFLIIVLGNICMSLWVHADMHDHGESHSHEHSVVHHHGDSEDSMSCCESIQEIDYFAVQGSNDIINIDVYTTNSQDISDENYIVLGLFRYHVFPDDPPKNISRLKSEKDSTELLL